jgi:hypothetical protein
MQSSVEIVELADRVGWMSAESDLSLPTHTWAYAKAMQASGFEPKLAVVRTVDAQMVMSFVERTYRGTTDIATIYGLSGASIKGRAASALDAWREHAISQGWVAGYVQLSPPADPPADLSAGDDYQEHNTIFLLDVGSDPQLTRASRLIRRKIKSAMASGVQLTSDRATLAETLVEMYPATMTRVGARVPELAADTIRALVFDPRNVVVGAVDGTAIRAAYLFVALREVAECHLLANDSASRHLTAFLLWHGAQALSERGVTTLNMGGGARPNDGIAAFKSRFNATTRPLGAVRQVFDRPTYDELCAAAAVSRAPRSWFPPYQARAESATVGS